MDKKSETQTDTEQKHLPAFMDTPGVVLTFKLETSGRMDLLVRRRHTLIFRFI